MNEKQAKILRREARFSSNNLPTKRYDVITHKKSYQEIGENGVIIPKLIERYQIILTDSFRKIYKLYKKAYLNKLRKGIK